MSSFVQSWKDTLIKLGVARQKRRKASRQNQLARRLRFENLESRQMLSITVNTFVDELDGSITDGDVSLRDAVDRALAGETIDFSTNPAHGLNGAIITLLPNLGEIAFAKSLTIDASMLSLGIRIDAGHGDDDDPGTLDGFRIFNITDPTSGSSPPLVTLIGLTLTGADKDSEGGAIRSTARLALHDCVIESNAALAGGGIWQFVASGGPSGSTRPRLRSDKAFTLAA